MSIAEKLTNIAENETKVYDTGKQTMSELWWKSISGNYTRTNWGYCFQYADISKVGNPKKIINAADGISCMFRYYQGESIPRDFDCSKLVKSPNYMTHTIRYASALKVFPDIKIPVMSAYSGSWQGCKALETIEMIRCDENTTFDATLDGCLNLKEVTFEGVIGQNISFSPCQNLSKDTLLSNGGNGVFGKLKNIKGTGETRTITLHADTKAMLTDAEKAIATEKGWTIS